jgi:hypothetical protein
VLNTVLVLVRTGLSVHAMRPLRRSPSCFDVALALKQPVIVRESEPSPSDMSDDDKDSSIMINRAGLSAMSVPRSRIQSGYHRVSFAEIT